MTYNTATFHLIALLYTLGVEVGLMALWASIAHPHPWRAIFCAFVVNLVSHTLFWYTQFLFLSDWPWGLYRHEALVIILEGALLAYLLSLSGITPWLLSALLNVTSLLTGLLLWQLIL